MSLYCKITIVESSSTQPSTYDIRMASVPPGGHIVVCHLVKCNPIGRFIQPDRNNPMRKVRLNATVTHSLFMRLSWLVGTVGGFMAIDIFIAS